MMWDFLKEKGVELPQISWQEINQQVEPVLREMEKAGVLIDVEVLHQLERKLESKIEGLVATIHHEAGQEFNINSPAQLSEILFSKLRLPTRNLKRTKTGVSTAASELAKLRGLNPIIEPILEYRELSKLLSTYLKPLPEMVGEDGRLHTTYGQETTTGRMTSEKPNLQNIPVKGEWGSEIRRAFIAPGGCKLVAADYSQIELRIVACLAQDPVMLKAFESGKDVHAATAAEIFNVPIGEVTSEQRRAAKTVNFGVLYGMSPYGLSEALGISREKAVQYIRRYFETHIGIKRYCEAMIRQAREKGCTETIFGFQREYPDIHSYNRSVAEAEERMAVNMPVQGTAAEILKLAMIELSKRIKNQEPRIKEARLILTVHDELVIEVCDEDVEAVSHMIQEVMENVVKLCVPLKVEVGVGQNWTEAKH